MHIDVARRPHQQNEENTSRTHKAREVRSQSQTRANARKFETKLVTAVRHQNLRHHKGSSKPQRQTIGTDFRYAVEFSKYGRTPATTSRPSWGQPWKHYAVRFAVSTARPSSPLPPLPVRRPRPILTDPVIGGSRSPALKVRIGATRRTVRTARRESQTVAGAPISAHRRTDRRRSGAH